MALVVGEAGIGKSALVEVFCDGADGVRVLKGSCDPIVPPRPFGPLVDVALDVKADAFKVTVTPSGRVFAWATYPAEPLVREAG